MRKIRSAVIKALEKYGHASAGMPSYHGSYETMVPQSMQKKIAKK